MIRIGEVSSLVTCSACGEEVSGNKMYKCYYCGRVYCRECAKEYPTIKTLGVCPDCEEAMEAEEDLG